MTKHDEGAKRHPGVTSTGAAAAAMAIDPAAVEATSVSVIGHDEIALLAYSYWEARGCPDGSPEEDWFRAEAELGKQAAA